MMGRRRQLSGETASDVLANWMRLSQIHQSESSPTATTLNFRSRGATGGWLKTILVTKKFKKSSANISKQPHLGRNRRVTESILGRVRSAEFCSGSDICRKIAKALSSNFYFLCCQCVVGERCMNTGYFSHSGKLG